MKAERYKMVKDDEGKYIGYHRKVVQDHLGRKLEFHEVVHHIDGNIANNDIANLKVMTHSEHKKLHGAERAARASNQTGKPKLRDLLPHLYKKGFMKYLQQEGVAKEVVSRAETHLQVVVNQEYPCIILMPFVLQYIKYLKEQKTKEESLKEKIEEDIISLLNH